MTVHELQEGFWKVNKGFYSISSTLKRLFRPKALKRRSNIIFMPMSFGHIPAVRKAHRKFRGLNDGERSDSLKSKIQNPKSKIKR
jgi:hypothetical protein